MEHFELSKHIAATGASLMATGATVIGWAPAFVPVLVCIYWALRILELRSVRTHLRCLARRVGL